LPRKEIILTIIVALFMDKPGYTLRQLVFYFLKLGAIGFGGPVALIGYMHRDLVEKRNWINDQDYKDGLALAQLAPGPLAAQLAIYTGYIDFGILGATLTGIAFVLPSYIMVVGLGWLYMHFGGLPWMQAVFFGVGAAVIGIITLSTFKLSQKSLGKDRLRWIIFLVLTVSTFLTENENVWLILLAGFVVWFVKSPPRFLKMHSTMFLMPVLLQASIQFPANERLVQIWWFFLKAGAFVFGSGLAIVPFLYGGVVNDYHWLNNHQFLDAVAVAMITPGPVVITVGFIGYLVAGFPGASIAALATFLPCYLFTILPAPYFKKYSRYPSIKAFIEGVTAAAIGAIAGAVIVLAKRQLIDITSIVIALSSLLVLLRFKKIQEPIVILAAAVIGLLLKLETW